MEATVVHTAHTSPIYGLCKTPTGGVLSAAGDGRVLRWEPSEPGTVRVVATMPSPIHCLLAHPVPELLLAGTSAGELFVLDTTRKEVAQRLHTHANGIFAVARLMDDRIAIAGGDGVLSIWQPTSGASGTTQLLPVRRIALCDAKLRGLASSRDGARLAIACGDGTVRVLDTTHFNEWLTYKGHEGGANTVAFHPGKPVLVSGGKDGYVRAWELTPSAHEVLALPAHRSTIYGIVFDPEGLRCASISRDKTVKLWDAASFDPLMRLDAKLGGHSHSVNALCWVEGALYTGGDDRKLIRWAWGDRSQNG